MFVTKCVQCRTLGHSLVVYFSVILQAIGTQVRYQMICMCVYQKGKSVSNICIERVCV